MTEKLCLKWNDFQQNTNTAFGSLRNDNDFSDITLACEDGQQVEAHKVILAASSPFFHTMLRRNKHPHPLIYMRGVKSEDLVAIVDFLYYGEANVYQENIDAFLAIAEELKLKGLTGNGNDVTLEEEVTKNYGYKENEKTKCTQEGTNTQTEHGFGSENRKESRSIKQEGHTRTETITSLAISGDLQELDEQVCSLLSKGENTIIQGTNTIKVTICNVCGKEGKLSNIKRHIEVNHLEGVSLPCNFCKKTFKSRDSLRAHKNTQHM